MSGLPALSSVRWSVSTSTSSMTFLWLLPIPCPLPFPLFRLLAISSVPLSLSLPRPVMTGFTRFSLFMWFPLPRLLSVIPLTIPVTISAPVRPLPAKYYEQRTMSHKPFTVLHSLERQSGKRANEFIINKSAVRRIWQQLWFNSLCKDPGVLLARLQFKFSLNTQTRTELITPDRQYSPLDSGDDFRSGCPNVSHYCRQQSFSGLHLPGRSDHKIASYP